MTFLDLVRRLRQEAGISGTGPTTVVGQTGELKRLVDWVADAWFEIQSMHRTWKFLRASTTFTTVNGQYAYTPVQAGIAADTFGRWIPETIRFYKTSVGTNSEQWTSHLDYDDWRDLWLFGANRSLIAVPLHSAIAPDDSLVIGPAPLVGYTVVADYYKAPVRLALDADEPDLPFRHDPVIIVYKALISYALYESAGESLQLGREEFARRLHRLETDQLEAPHFFGALC